MIHTSKKLMEVEVTIDVEIAAEQSVTYRRAAVGYFIMTSVNENGRLVNIPALKVTQVYYNAFPHVPTLWCKTMVLFHGIPGCFGFKQ